MVLPHSSSNAWNICQGGGQGFRYPSSDSSEEVMGGATSFPFPCPDGGLDDWPALVPAMGSSMPAFSLLPLVLSWPGPAVSLLLVKTS